MEHDNDGVLAAGASGVREGMIESNPLHASLTALYLALRDEMRSRWKRDLPLHELLFDRWERARSLAFGEAASIYHESYVYGDVRVGEHSWVGPFTLLDGSGGLTIGDYCVVSAGVHIYTHDTVRWALSGGRAPYERAPVTIGNCTYIGAQSAILKGVTVGDHAVIGAHSLVNRDVPAYSIAVGSPVRVIGHVEIGSDGQVSLAYPASAGT